MSRNILLCVSVISIAIMEIVAMIALHLDGVMLSAAVSSIVALVTRDYTIKRCSNGSDEFTARDSNRRRSAAAVSVG